MKIVSVTTPGGSAMHRNRTAPAALTLHRTQWETILDGLSSAGAANDPVWWCDCPVKEADAEICDDCNVREGRAWDCREAAQRITAQLGDKTGRITVVLLTGTWAAVVRGLADGATHIVDSLGFDCTRAGAPTMCEACTPEVRTAATIRALAIRIGRRIRRTHARPDRPDVAAYLTEELKERDETLKDWSCDIGDMTRRDPAPADEWEAFYEAIGERKQLAAHLRPRPHRRPRGTRARTGRR
jgi:hypothetical protein